jgi:tetratricopeptide (TPR) repeat protein
LAALVCTGVFLLHPLNTQAVTYVVQRMASLAALFTLVAFASYLVARHGNSSRSRWWYAAALAAFLLGLGSKENALLLLPVIVLYETCFFRDQWRRRAERLFGGRWNPSWTVRAWIGAGTATLLLAWVAVATSSALGLFDTFPGRDFSGLERLLTQTRVQLFHLSQLVWPTPERLNLDHDLAVSVGLLSPMTTLPAVLTSMVLLAAAVWLSIRQPRYGFPLLAYAVFHAIEAGPINLELIFEHRMYLPSTMLVVLSVALLADAKTKARVTALGGLVILLIPLANWTHDRNLVWSDAVTLNADIARKSPGKARAQHNYALALREAGRPIDAMRIAREALQSHPREDKLHALLADALMDLDRPQEALREFQTALNLNPDNMAPRLGIGRALQQTEGVDSAFQYYLSTGIQLGQGGNPWRAIIFLQEATELRAGDAEALHALGSAYLMAGMQQQAAEQFRAALESDADKYESWYNLAMAAEALGLNDEAIVAYQRFTELAPASLQQPINHAREKLRALKAAASD